ncbi:DUF1223 domain-containing protein [Mesorhizobium sp. M2D.F.Ca.ET.185.01.1.1]|uniref:DUF1223 domain-containing protein n=1 Tax=unclassified Mesorhizobium TaxID=325217 RepID=UPI000FCA7F10|nr:MULTISPECIES: DUF1223 domain-containing protein [unclassified Mesorhizobium]TGP72573.1 DUF1223 domain-containing protein [bacterium M00.F.Ca.ET.227.01.1.1]TGP83984.1 DUF1223 domain-containing protein [bacterium M00.F.Ca.ET.221.01.1.1]TGP85884.1 DUF1223 domain-containing protein [bacterium M00.F.Ca.ET.222.01.1.1]TGT96488.1 DUF1223 domain-containing protein [bacterium M00.F.Ca.ET.163.01.1.1]TGU17292.1 DUF1223 domain-containing protein [bacterium M00.F.Ca.ET.156.01.1.1]TGU42416.1 DUF1223 doma
MTGLKTSLLAGAMLAATVGAAAAQPLTVVELFTSQGCSSCPPANANLIKVKDQPGVLALSFNVTYWDYLGWKDTFGRKEFTERQVTYEPPLGHDGPFTPQVVVNGRADGVGARSGEIQNLIAQSLTNKGGRTLGPELSLGQDKVSVGAGKAPGGGADIWLVRYNKGVVEVPVARGENTGRTLPHANVVHALTRLGSWNGAATTLPLPAATGGLSTAVLVQAPGGGPILAAAAN